MQVAILSKQGMKWEISIIGEWDEKVVDNWYGRVNGQLYNIGFMAKADKSATLLEELNKCEKRKLEEDMKELKLWTEARVK